MHNYLNNGYAACNRQECTICPSYIEAAAYNDSMAYYQQPHFFLPFNHLGLYPVHPESRKRKREHDRDARDFSIRGLLGLSDDDSSSSDNSSYRYFTQELPAKIALLSPPAKDAFSRYEPISPISSENLVSSTYEAYTPNESDNPNLPARSVGSQSPTYSSSSSDGSSSPKKSRRIRTVFSPQQLEKLELEFEKTQYMVGAARVELATELGLTESQVKVWFQNRRIKERKQKFDSQKATLSKLNEDESYSSRSG